MDIATDKISQDIRTKIHHRLIDIINPDEHYTAGQRKKDAEKAIQDIQKHGEIPFIVGGTGLYIDTIYKNFTMPSCPPDYTLRQEREQEEAQNP
ncbi:MAG: hypothetical protein GXP45_08485 [bacterium]|nr:hypothetical protein [bacterium]